MMGRPGKPISNAVEGLNQVQIRQTDIAGNVSASSKIAFTLDQTPGAAPGVALAEDTGTVGDNITSDGGLQLSGVEADATVEYSIDDGKTWQTDFKPVEGLNQVQIRQTDIAGNVSASSKIAFTLDQTPGAAPGVALAKDTGTGDDNITSDGGLQLSGVEADATVEYSIDDGKTWQTDFKPVEGLNQVQIRQTDIAGNVSASSKIAFTLDQTPGAAPGVALAKDTGTGDDNITSDGGLQLSGVEADATVEYSIDDGKTWQTDFKPVEGLNQVQIRQTDIAGNVSASSKIAFTLDQTPGAAPGVALAKDTGTGDDNITSDGGLQLSGVEAGATVEYSIDDGKTWQTDFKPVEGLNQVQIRQTDIAGNVSASSKIAFTLDQTPGAAPGVALAKDTGTGDDITITSDGGLQLSGVEAGATVEYSIDDGKTWQTDFKPVEGLNQVQIRQTDIAGNVSASSKIAFTLDQTPGAAPGVALAEDTGTVGDNITSDGGLQLSGVEADATVEYSIDDGKTWQTDFKPVEGLNQVQIRQTDIAGNVSASSKIAFTLDQTPGAAPGVALAEDTGTGDDNITSDGGLQLSGVEADATVEYSIDDGKTWQTDFKPVEGLNQVQIRQTDIAGNVSASSKIAFTLDQTPGAAPGVALAKDTGTGDDNITSDGGLQLSGVEADATVEYSIDDGKTWQTDFKPVEGLNQVQIRQTDIAGNVSASSKIAFTLDQTPGAAPGVALAKDTGTGDDNITSDGGLQLSGVEAGATVEYSIDDGKTWQTDFKPVEGLNQVQIRQTDIAGNVSASSKIAFTLDQTPGAAPGVALAKDTGTGDDNITSDGGLQLSGVEADATVEYSIDDGKTWQTDFKPVEGLNQVQIRQTDIAGNVSASSKIAFTLDQTPGAAPGVALAKDTGTGDDNITSDGGLQLSGVEADATVEYSIDDGKTWQTDFKPVEGLNQVQIRQTDIAGNVSASSKIAFTLDQTPGAAPGVALAKDTGTGDDNITSDGGLQLSGVEADATVEYSIDDGKTWQTDFKPVEGLNQVQIRQTDIAGNVSASSKIAFTLDQTPGAAPGVALAKDTGTGDDNITSDGGLQLSGVEADATVEYSIDDGKTWQTDFKPVEGLNQVQIRQTDIAGNVSASSKIAFTLDQTPGAAPGVALAKDTGTGDDNITSDGGLQLSGVEAGATVEYSIDDGKTWQTDFKPVEGLNQVQIRQTDIAGNVSASSKIAFTLDQTPGAAPGVALAKDTGTVGDNITSDGGLQLSGVEADATVEYSIDDGKTWQTDFKPVEGLNQVQIRQTDIAGNVSASSKIAFTLDQTPGAAPGVALAKDTGTGDDNITSDGGLQLSGVEADATVEYSIDDGKTWQTDFKPVEGLNQVQIRQTDIAGNVSASSKIAFTLDQTPGAAPGVALAKDTGTGDDNITSDGGLQLSGVEADATVEYSIDDGKTWQTDFKPVEGLNQVQIRQTDIAGNVSASSKIAFTLDQTPGAAPGVALAKDTGTGDDNITSDGGLQLSGVEADATVEYSIDDGKTWQTDFKPVEGLNQVQIRQTDIAGNVSASSKIAFTLDQTPGAAPGVALAKDTGTGDDNITSDGGLQLSGVEAGATVEYSIDDGKTWQTDFKRRRGLEPSSDPPDRYRR